MLEWDGEPRELARCWTLQKPGRGEVVCTLWTHPLGRELRLVVNADLLRSQVFRDLAWADAAVEWRRAFEGKGWTS